MDKAEIEKVSAEETSSLGRNRSFKSKQLVRSQAIRESQSPPRTSSPAALVSELADISISDKANLNNNSTNKFNNNVEYNPKSRQNNVTLLTSNVKSGEPKVTLSLNNDKVRNNEVRVVKTQSDISSHDSVSDDIGSVTSFSEKSENDECKKKPPVEIQITPGGWEAPLVGAEAVRGWWGRCVRGQRDLLSNHPRLTCVCGRCHACPHCRGRRRKPPCPTKQDSGIVCSDDCPDCSDTENSRSTNTEHKKARSVDDDQSFYCRCPERKEKPKNISLSRSESDPTDQTSDDLVSFIKSTLNKNPKDRITLLRIEKELHSLVTDTGRSGVRFPMMSSYQRLLVHKVAALFELAHRAEPATKHAGAVVVSKAGTSGGRIPCTPFIEWCTSPLPKLTTPTHDKDTAKSILKRDTQSLDEPGSGVLSATRSKSLEQREKDYERVRRRIFSSDNCSQDESQWPWLNTGPVKLLTSESGRNKLLKVQSLESGCPGEKGAAKAALGKSHSFEHEGQRARNRSAHGELASSSWRLSPSSSGYRTLSLHSADSITPSPTGGGSPEPCGRSQECSEAAATVEGVVWAVTSLHAVPPGAIVIHPQTGRPLTNPDGSIYHFDPENPPPLAEATITEHKTEQNFEKRRGRLEKQHSFIENESECQVSEECRTKCCCQCQRHHNEKPTPETEQKIDKNPKSPQKHRYEQATEPPANQDSTPVVSANHKSPYEATNQKPPIDTNQHQHHSPSPNQRTVSNRQFETTNHKQENRFENQRQLSFDQSQYDVANQRAGNEIANHRLTNQETQDIQYYGPQYTQYRHEDMVSPQMVPQMVGGYTQEMMIHAMTPNKIMPIADPNIRPMSLTNVMYPAPMPQPYQFVNQCRIEQPLQTVYQPIIATEDKQLAPSPHTDSTFRIDPSYPYMPTDITGAPSCCAPCVDTTAVHHRSTSVAPYAVESATFQPTAAVIPPAPQIHYPYPEQLQWGGVAPMGAAPKLYVQEVYPLVHYTPLYTHYNHLVYPQMVPQYPVANMAAATTTANPPRLPKRNSLPGSSRATPLQTPPTDKKPHPDRATKHAANANVAPNLTGSAPANSRSHGASGNSNDIAATIQQITDQLNARTRPPNRNEWRRRNSGSGLLGAPPPHAAHQTAQHATHVATNVQYAQGNQYASHSNNRHTRDTNEPQLSSAARAIVNSLRSIQGKSHYQDRRQDFNPSYNRDNNGSNMTRRGQDGDRRDTSSNHYRPGLLLRQMSPGTWCRRSPGPVHPVLNNPRRPHPDTRPPRR